MGRYTVPSSGYTFYFCCSSDSSALSAGISLDSIARRLPLAFVLMRKGGTCQPINGRVVSTGEVLYVHDACFFFFLRMLGAHACLISLDDENYLSYVRTHLYHLSAFI